MYFVVRDVCDMRDSAWYVIYLSCFVVTTSVMPLMKLDIYQTDLLKLSDAYLLSKVHI